MDPATIAALATGITGIAAAIGSTVVAICRTQKNSVTQGTNEQAQDAVRVDNHGSKTVNFLWGCFSYSRDPDSIIILNETDQSGSHVDAVRFARGYQAPPQIGQQPARTVVPGLSSTPSTTPDATSGTQQPVPSAQQSPTPQPQADTPLEDVNVAELPQLADNKNHCSIKKFTSSPDGTCSFDSLELSLMPEKSNGGAKDTHYAQEITRSAVPAIQEIAAAVVKKVQEIATKGGRLGQHSAPSDHHSVNGEDAAHQEHRQEDNSETSRLLGGAQHDESSS